MGAGTKLKKIIVAGVYDLPRLLPSIHERFITISILSPEFKDPVSLSHPFLVNVLSLRFHDFANDGKIHSTYPVNKPLIPFKDKDARAAIDFVIKYKDEAEILLIYCEAGMSRSAGMARAFGEILNIPVEYKYHQDLANQKVYRLIIDTYRE